MREPENRFRHLPRGEDEIGQTDIDQTARHGREFRLLGILGNADPTDGFDRLGPGGAVAAHAGHDNRDSSLLLFLRERAKKIIDRMLMAAFGGRLAEMKSAISEHHRPARTNHIGMVRFDDDAILDLGHRNIGPPIEQFRDHALPFRGQMLDQDETDSAVGWQGVKELEERF